MLKPGDLVQIRDTPSTGPFKGFVTKVESGFYKSHDGVFCSRLTILWSDGSKTSDPEPYVCKIDV